MEAQISYGTLFGSSTSLTKHPAILSESIHFVKIISYNDILLTKSQKNLFRKSLFTTINSKMLYWNIKIAMYAPHQLFVLSPRYQYVDRKILF